MNNRLLTVTLAAGLGTRMKSARPKVMHEIGGRSMLAHVLALAGELGSLRNAVVVGPELAGNSRSILPAGVEAETYIQHERLGTAHALLSARSALESHQGHVIVLFGDTPLLRRDSLEQVKQSLDGGAHVVVLGFEAKNPAGYGRLITDAAGGVRAIREDKDASDEERRITLCNSGVFGFRSEHLLSLLDSIGNENRKQEYYLTDAVELAVARGLATRYVSCSEEEVMGVNSRNDLAVAERIYQQRRRAEIMAGGVTLLDPDSVYFCYDTRIGQDVLIEPHVFFGPGVTIGDDVHIKAFCHIEAATIGRSASVGPYARLRPGAEIGDKAKLGNFIEIKKSRVEEGAKVPHLSYIGDARIGKGANIGAGTITCNYDGFNKHFTDIGEGAFIGSNSSLVAPLKIGDGAMIGSGSVVTRNVDADALAVARARQEQKDGWAGRFREMNLRMKEKKRAEAEAAGDGKTS
jgi:bifunctional UDP-N-acetylglucosamine pyrophosphorylase/glucosamine-1-phosphate N-acetyltransferase